MSSCPQRTYGTGTGTNAYHPSRTPSASGYGGHDQSANHINQSNNNGPHPGSMRTPNGAGGRGAPLPDQSSVFYKSATPMSGGPYQSGFAPGSGGGPGGGSFPSRPHGSSYGNSMMFGSGMPRTQDNGFPSRASSRGPGSQMGHSRMSSPIITNAVPRSEHLTPAQQDASLGGSTNNNQYGGYYPGTPRSDAKRGSVDDSSGWRGGDPSATEANLPAQANVPVEEEDWGSLPVKVAPPPRVPSVTNRSPVPLSVTPRPMTVSYSVRYDHHDQVNGGSKSDGSPANHSSAQGGQVGQNPPPEPVVDSADDWGSLPTSVTRPARTPFGTTFTPAFNRERDCSTTGERVGSSGFQAHAIAEERHTSQPIPRAAAAPGPPHEEAVIEEDWGAVGTAYPIKPDHASKDNAERIANGQGTNAHASASQITGNRGWSSRGQPPPINAAPLGNNSDPRLSQGPPALPGLAPPRASGTVRTRASLVPPEGSIAPPPANSSRLNESDRHRNDDPSAQERSAASGTPVTVAFPERISGQYSYNDTTSAQSRSAEDPPSRPDGRDGDPGGRFLGSRNLAAREARALEGATGIGDGDGRLVSSSSCPVKYSDHSSPALAVPTSDRRDQQGRDTPRDAAQAESTFPVEEEDWGALPEPPGRNQHVQPFADSIVTARSPSAEHPRDDSSMEQNLEREPGAGRTPFSGTNQGAAKVSSGTKAAGFADALPEAVTSDSAEDWGALPSTASRQPAALTAEQEGGRGHAALAGATVHQVIETYAVSPGEDKEAIQLGARMKNGANMEDQRIQAPDSQLQATPAADNWSRHPGQASSGVQEVPTSSQEFTGATASRSAVYARDPVTSRSGVAGLASPSPRGRGHVSAPLVGASAVTAWTDEVEKEARKMHPREEPSRWGAEPHPPQHNGAGASVRPTGSSHETAAFDNLRATYPRQRSCQSADNGWNTMGVSSTFQDQRSGMGLRDGGRDQQIMRDRPIGFTGLPGEASSAVGRSAQANSEWTGGGGSQCEGRDSQQVTCHNCGRIGHYMADCSEERQHTATCYGCGRFGHWLAHCPEERHQIVRCFNCGTTGHYSSVCPEERNQAYRNHQLPDRHNRDNGERIAPWRLFDVPRNACVCGDMHWKRDCPFPIISNPEGHLFGPCDLCTGDLKSRLHWRKDCPESQKGQPQNICGRCRGAGHDEPNCAAKTSTALTWGNSGAILHPNPNWRDSAEDSAQPPSRWDPSQNNLNTVVAEQPEGSPPSGRADTQVTARPNSPSEWDGPPQRSIKNRSSDPSLDISAGITRKRERDGGWAQVRQSRPGLLAERDDRFSDAKSGDGDADESRSAKSSGEVATPRQQLPALPRDNISKEGSESETMQLKDSGVMLKQGDTAGISTERETHSNSNAATLPRKSSHPVPVDSQVEADADRLTIETTVPAGLTTKDRLEQHSPEMRHTTSDLPRLAQDTGAEEPIASTTMTASEAAQQIMLLLLNGPTRPTAPTVHTTDKPTTVNSLAGLPECVGVLQLDEDSDEEADKTYQAQILPATDAATHQPDHTPTSKDGAIVAAPPPTSVSVSMTGATSSEPEPFASLRYSLAQAEEKLHSVKQEFSTENTFLRKQVTILEASLRDSNTRYRMVQAQTAKYSLEHERLLGAQMELVEAEETIRVLRRDNDRLRGIPSQPYRQAAQQLALLNNGAAQSARVFPPVKGRVSAPQVTAQVTTL